jgi:hypothetical protein
MAGKFRCESCAREYPWKPEQAGKRAKCKYGAVLSIPATDPAPPPEDEVGMYDIVEPVAPPRPTAPPPMPVAPVGTITAPPPVRPLAYATPANVAGRCQSCGAHAPTKYVEFHQNVGALVMRFHRSVRGQLCKSCIHSNFWKMTGTTMAVGWLGTISLVLTPIFVINNIVRYLGCLSLPASHEE